MKPYLNEIYLLRLLLEKIFLEKVGEIEPINNNYISSYFLSILNETINSPFFLNNVRRPRGDQTREWDREGEGGRSDF